MDREAVKAKLGGCYIALPTLFRDGDLELNLPGMRRHVRFLLEGGARQGNAVLLVAGAAGDFTTLSVDERLQIAEAVLDEAAGKIGIIVGAQSTSLREVQAIAVGAARLGGAIQIGPPFYHSHTEGDVLDFLTAATEAADIGAVLYSTYWVCPMSLDLVGQLSELPNMVGLKWSAPSFFEFEMGVKRFSERLCVIDNQLQIVQSHIWAKGINLHPGNYWPQWAVRLWNLLESGKYREAQAEMSRVLIPYYELASEVAKYTGGEGHLDKLCLELVGLDSSGGRPPIRDIRPQFREKARQMLQKCGVPKCKPGSNDNFA